MATIILQEKKFVKDNKIETRVDPVLRDMFLEYCEKNSLNKHDLIRAFISDFVSKNYGKEFDRSGQVTLKDML